MLQATQAFIITLTLSAFSFADVLITELTDPQNSSDAGRYVELYNNGSSDVDLSTGWKIQRWTNGNSEPTASSIKDLTGIISAGGFYIVCNNADKFSETYGLTCDQDVGTGGAADSNGDDNIAILNPEGNIHDIFGVPGEDGTGTGHEFEDGRAERAEGVMAANATWDETEWNVDNDSGGGDGNQYAPEGFDPASWVGETSGGDSGGSDTCTDETACNNGSEGDCEYPESGYDCDGNCVSDVDCNGVCGGDAVIDECGECGGSNACLNINVTFSVNMALEEVSDDGVRLYGIDGDWSTGIAMIDDDDDNIYTSVVSLTMDSFYLYKFKNGGSWENVPEESECSWFDDPDGDGFGYWDRYINLDGVTEDLTVDSVCFSSCSDCPSEVLGCTDPLADNYNAEANVDDGTCEYSFPDPANLFFSEYAEGSSNNKYLEIYNASEDWVELNAYSLSSCSNGCNDGVSWDYPDNVTFEGDIWLEPGDVYVVCHGSSDDIILAECDQTFTYLSNGDDVFALTQIGSGTILDIIGTIGDDPGSGWEVAGVNNATKDHTLVRDALVSSGNGGDWEQSAGNVDMSEWVVLDQNTWSYLGSHPHDFTVTCNDEAACNAGEEGDCVYAEQGYDCDGNAYINVTFLVDMNEQTVDTEGYGLDLFLPDPYGYYDMEGGYNEGGGIHHVTLQLAANTTYTYKFKNGDEWEGNFNDLGCGAGDQYGNRIFTSGDSDMTLEAVCFNSCDVCGPPDCVQDCEGIDDAINSCEDDDEDVANMCFCAWFDGIGGSDADCFNDCDETTLADIQDIEAMCSEYGCTMGDVNGDSSVDVLDIVQIVGYIIDTDVPDFDSACADSNGDGLVDVLDLVQIVGIIIGERNSADDATQAKLIKEDGVLFLNANGYIGGVQMTLSHNLDFSLELTGNAMVADYNTTGDQTKIVIVSPGSDELFSYSGDFEVVDVIIANSTNAVHVNSTPNEFKFVGAYPNPFNPVTSLTLDIPEAGYVSVEVYNVMGQVVETLESGYLEATTKQNPHFITWDASSISSGVYFVKAEAAGVVTTQKLMLLK